MTIDSDIAVVGLGPAGCSAALAAARGGARVTGFDRKRTPGHPVQCAEFVPALLGDDAPVMGACIQSINAMHSYVEDGEADARDDFRGRMIDRAAFDAALADDAQTAGAVLSFGAQLERVGSDGALHFADGRVARARVIVAADGPRSPVATAIGRADQAIVETRQVSVRLLRRHNATDIYLSAALPGGYGWLFPKGEVANAGVGLDPRWRALLKPALDGLIGRLAAEGRIDPEPLGHTGGAIPVGGMRHPSARIGDVAVLLAGDACGLANPVTGAGISAACLSGRMAGEAAARIASGDAAAGPEYAEDIDDLFGVALARAVKRRQTILAIHAQGRAPTIGEQRDGWIAYPGYWQPDSREEIRHDLLEA